MIGCIAQAGSVDMAADEHEMEEVRWVTKAGKQLRGVALLSQCCCILKWMLHHTHRAGPALIKLCIVGSVIRLCCNFSRAPPAPPSIPGLQRWQKRCG
jgi:hypothetical protein